MKINSSNLRQAGKRLGTESKILSPWLPASKSLRHQPIQIGGDFSPLSLLFRQLSSAYPQPFRLLTFAIVVRLSDCKGWEFAAREANDQS
jgi:hypothetical protein